jgi:hypothetical protein
MFSALKLSLINLLKVLITFQAIFAWAAVLIHLTLVCAASLVFLAHDGLGCVVEWLVVDGIEMDGKKERGIIAMSHLAVNVHSALVACPLAPESWLNITDAVGDQLGYLANASF